MASTTYQAAVVAAYRQILSLWVTEAVFIGPSFNVNCHQNAETALQIVLSTTVFIELNHYTLEWYLSRAWVITFQDAAECREFKLQECF